MLTPKNGGTAIKLRTTFRARHLLVVKKTVKKPSGFFFVGKKDLKVTKSLQKGCFFRETFDIIVEE